MAAASATAALATVALATAALAMAAWWTMANVLAAWARRAAAGRLDAERLLLDLAAARAAAASRPADHAPDVLLPHGARVARRRVAPRSAPMNDG